jgi:hypothetical protein
MGSGGGTEWPKRPEELEKLVKDAISDEQRSKYATDLNSYLEGLLADINKRDPDIVNRHLDTIKDALSKENEESITLLHGGSMKKHTYVDGLSDVDILAIINNSALENESPQRVLEYFAERLRERLPKTTITVGKLAVTIKFSDGTEVQVLPALTTKTGIRIASAEGTEWSNVVKPDKFAQKITSVNQESGGRVVPVVKLYKVINSQLPEEAKLSGYHIESLAVNAFEDYEGSRSYKDMLQHLAEYASNAVLHPIEENTGQSIHVDDKLGPANSPERQRASASIKRIVTRMKSGDSEAQLDRWMQLMGDSPTP